MTTPNPERIAEIAESLSDAQRKYLSAHYDRTQRKGRPHGLVARGLLRYAWGLDSSMGYKDTALGLAVRDHLKDAK